MTTVLGQLPKNSESQATCRLRMLMIPAPLFGIPQMPWRKYWMKSGSLVTRGRPSKSVGLMTVPEVATLPCQQLPGYARFEISARSTLLRLPKKPL